MTMTERSPIKSLDPASCTALVTTLRWMSKFSIQPNGCWLWTGARYQNGYGMILVDGRVQLAHRVALVASLGRDIAPGMQAGHLCHDWALVGGTCLSTTTQPCEHRRCVNPAHLAEQTAGENLSAIPNRNSLKTHCPRGHPLADDNLIVRVRTVSKRYPSGVTRECRECANARKRKVRP